RCEKCAQALSRCALCEQPVRSLYVWCPGCGHGGHLHHMHEWFTQASACPTGCGHHCNLNLVLCEVP
ncbi:WD repeat-containing protein 24, partial [Tribonema minus]